VSFFQQVLASKEIHAAGLKRRLGITAWREFSEDMQQGLKSLQVSVLNNFFFFVADAPNNFAGGCSSQNELEG
jgi:Tumour protein D52 family